MSSNEICPICIIAVTSESKGIACDDSCKRWFHASCVKITNAEYAKLANDLNKKWSCGRDDCLNAANQPLNVLITQLSALGKNITALSNKVDTLISLPNKMDQIITDVDRLNKNIESLNDRVTSNEARIRTLEDASKNPQTCTALNQENMIAEMNDRARRASNVMVYGLVESTSANIDDRKLHDLNAVSDLFKTFYPEFDNSKTKTARVGKRQTGKSRPLKVILNSERDARHIISSFSGVSAPKANSKYSSVKISRDRTPQEQKYFKSLLDELHDRESKGEANLTIKFKNNVPCIVKTSKND